MSDHIDLLLFFHISIEKQEVETDGYLQKECIFLRCGESGVSQEVEYIIKNRNSDSKERSSFTQMPIYLFIQHTRSLTYFLIYQLSFEHLLYIIYML